LGTRLRYPGRESRRGSGIHGTDFGEQKARSREDPAYNLAEAAYYLGIPVATLRSWITGRTYPTARGTRLFQRIIEPAAPGRLSFVNLVEAHVLSALRRDHQIQLPKIRQAVGYLRRHFRSHHPLADHLFETDGLDLFVEKYSKLVNVTKDGQLAMREVLKSFLRRIRRDNQGAPVRLYLFTHRGDADEPQSVMVDPTISFGRPVLEGTGIPTEILAQRYKAGDLLEALASDYGRPREEIEEAIRYELLKAA
jgi:uncharacterized protein (DUF433 family)